MSLVRLLCSLFCLLPWRWTACQWALAALALTAGLATPWAGAATPAPLLSEFTHSAWTVDDGAPADVWTLARSPSGYLWLGTGLGLYRFDGVRFDRYRLREGQRLQSTNINALYALPDGDVWIGLFAGGTVRLHDGWVSAYGEAEGMPAGRVLQFAATEDGTLWAAANSGLARFDGTRWQRIGAEWQYPEQVADYVFVDHRGVLWVASGQTLVYLPPGERLFKATGERISRGAVLAEDRQGRVWVSDDRRGTRPLPDYPGNAAAVPRQAAEGGKFAAPGGVPFARAKQMLFSADGSLWLSELGVGVRHLRDPAAVPVGRSLVPADRLERFSSHDGLASDVVVPLVQDAEGDVWVGTNFGLGSFHIRRLHGIPELAGAPRDGFALTTDGEGVLVSNAALALRLNPPLAPVRQTRPLNPRTLLRASDGALWLIDEDSLVREAGGQFRRIWLGGSETSYSVPTMAADQSGGVWFSAVGVGVFHAGAAAGQVRREPRVEREGATANAIGVGPDGAVWFGYDDEVLCLRGEQVTRYTAVDGLAVGRATTIGFGRDGKVYVAGESGLARWDGQRFASLSAERDDAFAHITGVAEADNGDLWLNGGRGVLQVKAGDLSGMFSLPAERPEYRLFDWRDGLPGIAQQAASTPTLVRDAHGRLWFVTNRGVAWLDPARVPRNERLPPVEIQQLRAGDRNYLPTDGLSLPAGTRNLAIRYTALTLSGAERAHFRYRLEGVDTDWQDADTRREATYANLHDGEYRFRVIAANGDGVWNPVGTELRFSIEPTWLESRQFAWLCAALVLGLLVGVYLLRVRTIAARVQLRLEARHAERERIARELHDTLLQSTQGLILNVQGLASRLAPTEPVRDQIEALLDRADGVVLEARDRVRDLRKADVGGGELQRVLELAGHELAARSLSNGAGPGFRVLVTGMPRALKRTVYDELYRIAREALLNAFQHAQAGAIKVSISYAEAELVLQVEDDGIGLPPLLLERGARPDHWGLAGMRERARSIGARLTLSSTGASGTRVVVLLPAAIAYSNDTALHMAADGVPREPLLQQWATRWRAALARRLA